MLIVPMSGALELNCFTQINHWTNHGSIDECIFGNVVVSLPQEPITSVSMEQSGNDYNDDSEQTTVAAADPQAKNKILSFYILSSPLCFYVPSGIAENFKNIKVLIIANTGLRVITQVDLKPLKKLRNLYVDNNQLTSLDDDLFLSNPSIEYINVSNNQIKSVGMRTFEPLTGLKELGFYQNICIDDGAKSIRSVNALKLKLKTKCLLDR